MEPSAQEHAFAAEVERCRVAARVNQQWVAQRVGLSQPKVTEICRGRFLPSQLCPSRQAQAVAVLRGLAPDRPLHRRQVLVALGALRPGEAMQPLRLMAQDRSLGPVVRLRCAEALANPCLEQREAASLVARELMHDHGVPWHVRRHAARDLARWSELCRDEAREVINRVAPA